MKVLDKAKSMIHFVRYSLLYINDNMTNILLKYAAGDMICMNVNKVLIVIYASTASSQDYPKKSHCQMT